MAVIGKFLYLLFDGDNEKTTGTTDVDFESVR